MLFVCVTGRRERKIDSKECVFLVLCSSKGAFLTIERTVLTDGLRGSLELRNAPSSVSARLEGSVDLDRAPFRERKLRD